MSSDNSLNSLSGFCCDTAVIVAFAVYLAAMLGIGFVAWARTKDLEDYILGGRSLGAWVAALSAGASDMSGWLLMGLPGLAYASGLGSVWIAAGLLAGTWLNWLILAPRLRRETARTGALTIPEFFATRFPASAPTIRLVSALFILIFFTIYTCSGMVAGGKLFNTVFGIPYTWAVLSGGAAVMAYTFLGGFLAVSWTDAVQASLMFAALVFVPAAVFFLPHQGAGTAIPQGFFNPLTSASGTPLSLVTAVSLVAWGAGYFGQPHILARFMAIEEEDDVSRARRIAVTWSAVTLAGAIASGIAGVVYLGPGLADSEKVFMILVRRIMPPVVAGACLSAVLAAIMSTADSQLLVSASVFTEDFYRVFLRRRAGQGELVTAGRVAVIMIAIAACLLALDPESRVLGLVSYAWAGFGAAFGPVMVLSLYWKRLTGRGAVAGIAVGGLVVLAWKNLHGGIFDLYEIIPGILGSTAAAFTLSVFVPEGDGPASRPEGSSGDQPA